MSVSYCWIQCHIISAMLKAYHFDAEDGAWINENLKWSRLEKFLTKFIKWFQFAKKCHKKKVETIEEICERL